MEDGKVIVSRNIGSVQFLEALKSQAKVFEFYLLDDCGSVKREGLGELCSVLSEVHGVKQGGCLSVMATERAKLNDTDMTRWKEGDLITKLRQR